MLWDGVEIKPASGERCLAREIKLATPDWIVTLDRLLEGTPTCKWKAAYKGQPVTPYGWQILRDGQWVEIVGPVDIRRAGPPLPTRPVHFSRCDAHSRHHFRELGQINKQAQWRAINGDDHLHCRLPVIQNHALAGDLCNRHHWQIVAPDLGDGGQQSYGALNSGSGRDDKASGIVTAFASPYRDVTLEFFDSRRGALDHLCHHDSSPSSLVGPNASVAEAGEATSLPGGGQV